MNWLCKFGIHKWTKWKPTTLRVRPAWSLSDDFGYTRQGQERECQKCGVEELR